MSNQFGRKATLIVSNGTDGLDLSELRFTFNTSNSDSQTPNTCYVRVYNLKRDTAAKIGTEFSTIILQAGYENGNFGQIFLGSIKQTETGRERNVDSYVNIWAADGDAYYNFNVISRSLAAGANQSQVLQAILGSSLPDAAPPVTFADDVTGLIVGTGKGTQQALSRGKVLFGLSRDYLRDWAQSNGFRWSIQGGKLVVVPISGYRPGEAVVLSSNTGLIGVPDATNAGLTARCLLNPLIRIGCLVQIAHSDINQITMQQWGLSLSKDKPPVATTVTNAGFYRVMQAEMAGDTRGNEWYSDLICLAVDATEADQAESVSP